LIGLDVKIVVDSKDNAWFATGEFNGLYRYDGKAIESYPYSGGFVNTGNGGMTNCMYIDKNDHIWIGNNCALEFDGNSYKISLTNEMVKSITKSSDGTVWICTITDFYKDFKLYSNQNIERSILTPQKNNCIWAVSTFIGKATLIMQP
jgi:ligand-binding sensor domain-containing protein